MDVLILLDKLDDLIYNAKQVPLTEQVRVDRDEVYSLLDQIRVTLPEEIKQARWIVEERRQAGGDEQVDNRQLQSIAESIEELRHERRPSPPPLTAAAAERVRSIIQAAEDSAAEVRRDAELEAREIESEAARRGVEIRKRSASEAAARLQRADDATKALVEEATSARAELEGLLERVREPASTLSKALGEGVTTFHDDLQRMRSYLEVVDSGERRDREHADQLERQSQGGRDRRRQRSGDRGGSPASGDRAYNGDEAADAVEPGLPGPEEELRAHRIADDPATEEHSAVELYDDAAQEWDPRRISP
jgi:hypothetical protein